MFSIIIPWRNRTQLSTTIKNFKEVVDNLQGEIVIINFGGDAILLDSLIPQNNRQRIKIVHLHDITYFNLSATRNIGAHHASHDVLFFCDCDVLIDYAIVKNNLDTLAKQDNIFINPEGVLETDGGRFKKTGKIIGVRMSLALTFDDGRAIEIPTQSINREKSTRAAKGLLFIRKPMLLAINGYNSGFEGWGWEDSDLVIRLQAALGAKQIVNGFFTHLSHDDEERIQYYEIQDRQKTNRAAYEAGLERYDQGNFLGTYQEDIKRFHSCEVINYQ